MKTITKACALISCTATLIFSACQKNDLLETSLSDEQEVQAELLSNSPDPEFNARNFGVEFLSESEYKMLPQVKESPQTRSFPASKFLSCPTIGNQGGEGSCVAFGVAYEAYSIGYRYKHGGSFTTSTNIFSPEFVYNQIKAGSSCGSGAYVTTGLNLLKTKGACLWSKMPYSSTNGCSLMPNTIQLSNAASRKIVSYSTVSKAKTAFKDQLVNSKRAIIIATNVDNAFCNLGNNQVYSSYSGSSLGGHCYTIVGYDDSKGAFKVMNSWGTGWGSSGFGWIKYSLVYDSNFLKEAYVINL